MNKEPQWIPKFIKVEQKNLIQIQIQNNTVKGENGLHELDWRDEREKKGKWKTRSPIALTTYEGGTMET